MTDDDQTTSDSPATPSWMKRVAWRRVLPITQILLAVTLIGISRAREDAFYAEIRSRRPEPPPPREDAIQFDPVVVWDHGDPLSSLVMAINLPAVIATAPLLLVLGDAKHGAALVAGLVALLFCIAILWYWIGRGLDRRFGSVGRPAPRKKRRRVMIAKWVGFLGGIGVAIFGCYGVTTAIFFFVQIFAAGFVVWGAAFAVYFGRMVFHPREEGSSS